MDRGCGFPHQSHIGATSVFSFFTEKVSSFSHRFSHIGTRFARSRSHRFSHIGTIFSRPRSHRFSHIGSVFAPHRCFLVFPSTSVHIGNSPHRRVLQSRRHVSVLLTDLPACRTFRTRGNLLFASILCSRETGAHSSLSAACYGCHWNVPTSLRTSATKSCGSPYWNREMTSFGSTALPLIHSWM